MLTLSIGLVTALLALPVVAGVGLFAKASADHYLDLPSDLATPPLPQNSEIVAGDGTVIATLHGEQNRVVVDGEQIPKIMRDAIVAIEDSRFYEHGGFDPKGVLRAALRNGESGDVQQGGSTLTQQYVKNVLLQNARTPEERKAATDPSVSRKIQELRYAAALEKKLPKDEILTRYLNIAYFGDGAYGVGTAAQHYFGVDVSKLTLVQAAMLAGLVQSPSRYDPSTNPDAAKKRRNEVLDAMATNTYVSRTQADAAKQMPIALNITSGQSVDSCVESAAPFFCDYVRTQLLSDKSLGATPEERQRRVYEGGLEIHTTLDTKVQQAAQNAVDTTMGKTNRVSSTEVVVQPGTGNILAMAVNQAYGVDSSQFQTKLALPTLAQFEPGSAFKTFTMAAALEQGYGTSTAFYSPACYTTDAFPIEREGDDECAKGYTNADPAEAGIYDMNTGTWDSVNTYYIQLEEKVGVMSVADMAERLGVPAKDLKNAHPTFGGLTISQQTPVSPLDMANAYATIAASGKYCAPRYVTSATDSANKNVDIAPQPDCKQVLDPKIANTVSSVLAGVVTKGTGTKAAIGRPVAGKTGTNDSYSSAWFIGFTPQMASAVEVGDWRGRQVENELRNVQADNRTWPRVFGGDLPALIFSRTLKPALQGAPVVPLAKADPKTVQGTKGGLLNTPPPATPSPGTVLIDPNTGQPFPSQPGPTPTVPGGDGTGAGTGGGGGGGDGGPGSGGQFPGQDGGPGPG
jgi:membrane peptidoglycan carboxypeptidase